MPTPASPHPSQHQKDPFWIRLNYHGNIYKKYSQAGLSKLLGPFIKVRLPLMKNIIKLLIKSVLIPLGIIAAALAADTIIHKKFLGWEMKIFSKKK